MADKFNCNFHLPQPGCRSLFFAFTFAPSLPSHVYIFPADFLGFQLLLATSPFFVFSHFYVQTSFNCLAYHDNNQNPTTSSRHTLSETHISLFYYILACQPSLPLLYLLNHCLAHPSTCSPP